MRRITQPKEVAEEVPDNTVFWATVGTISVFVLVLAVVMIVREGSTGQIVIQWEQPSRPFDANPYACLDVPPCGDGISFQCCANEPLPGTGQKCTAPLAGYGEMVMGYGYQTAYDNYGAGNPVCPKAMRNRCPCPEKFQYRQSWPVPGRYG